MGLMGKTMLREFCEPYYLVVIGALLIALFAFGVGKGVGKLLAPMFKKLLGKEGGVIVNLAGGNMAKSKDGTCRINPADCPAHQAEHERSKRNEEQIKELWGHHDALKIEIMTELKSIQGSQQKILLALVSTGKIRPGDV